MCLSFQEVPWDIAYAIVHNVTDKSQCEKAGMLAYRNPGLKFTLPLLKVCHTWRSATQAYLCQVIDINFSHNHPKPLYKYRRWPTCKDDVAGYGSKLVKTANLTANIITIATGQALHQLIELSTVMGQFSKARILNIRIACSSITDDKQFVPSEHCVYQFCDQLKTTFPGAKNINIVYDGNYSAESSSKSKLINILVCNLFNKAYNTSLQIFTGSQIAALGRKPIANLTSLNVSWCHNYQQIAKLIQLNSECLHALEIKFIIFDGLEDIVVNGKSYIKYPAMKRLHLTTSKGVDSPLMAFSTKGILFPQLHHLHLEINYPFNDDTLFRRNNSTLAYLRMAPNTAVFQMLIALGAFSNDKYNKLNHLSIARPDYRMYNTQWHLRNFHKFIKKFSTTIKSLSLPFISDEITPVDTMSYSMLIPRNIKKLEITNVNLDINELIVILKGLPNLVSLICGYSNIGLSNIDDEYLNNKYASHYPLNTSLWHWSASYFNGYIHMATVECALLLAILCPNYLQTKDINYTPEGFNKYLLNAKMEFPFDKYSESIDRILLKTTPKIEYKELM